MGETGGTPPRRPADDANEHRVTNALREALATRRHGEMLFDMVAALLGPAARVEAAPDGSSRRLFRAEGDDPRWLVPWPLLTLSLKAPGWMPSPFPDAEPAPERLPRPGRAPNLRGLGPGWITIHDGRDHLQVGYEEDGRWCETVRYGPPETLEGLLDALAKGGAPTVERLADFVATLDIARRGPGRSWLPAGPLGGAQGVWLQGLRAIREALARDGIPAGAPWVAADGIEGTALAWGASRDEALFAWSAEVERVRPGPAAPMGLPEGFDPEGPRESWKGDPPERFPTPIQIGPKPPPPPPEQVPGALVLLGDLPAEPPALGAWRRFLGECGTTVPAAVREDRGGWTVVGDRVLAAMALPDIEAALDEADREHEALMRKHFGDDPVAHLTSPFTRHDYRLVDERTGRPVKPAVGRAGGLAASLLPALDGDTLRTGAVRVRGAKG